MAKLRFALMGCGRIAKRHAEILSGGVSNAELVAVCDPIQERAEKFGADYKVPHYSNVAAMLTNENIDVVNVLTPSGYHAANVLEVASFGKHVVVEKPMALTLEDADSMIDACRAAGVRLFVVKQNRYNYPVVKLREAVVEGRFGKLVMGTVRVRWCRTDDYYRQDAWRGTWALDGGVFTNQASHHIDLLEWMMGDVESVFAKSSTRLASVEVEDTGIAVLKFRNGALGVIEATTATRPKDLEGSISILGEKGTVEIGGFAVNKMKTWQFTEPRPEDEEVVGKFAQNPPNVYGFGHQAYLQEVVDSIVHDRPAVVDGLAGRRSLELIHAIYESIETGREIRLHFRPEHSKLGAKATTSSLQVELH